MNPRPVLFVSAVSRELRTARRHAARLLHSMGYDPKDQDMARAEHGELRAVLRKWIDQSAGVIQLVGECYGAAPRDEDPAFGPCSYTQYEAFYARQTGKPVWYFFTAPGFAPDPHDPEPDALRALQHSYIQRIRDANDLRTPSPTTPNSRSASAVSRTSSRNSAPSGKVTACASSRALRKSRAANSSRMPSSPTCGR